MSVLPLLLLTFLHNVFSSICPYNRNISITGSHVLSTDSFQTSAYADLSSVCRIGFYSPGERGLIVSVTHFFLFSHRQPKNIREIVIKNGKDSFSFRAEAKAYRWFSGPIEVEMPINLNFRAIVVITSVKNCSSAESFPCSKLPLVCVSRDYLCDENDNCGEEVNCSETKRHLPLTAFEYDKDALSSSQLMLIGFFIVNLSFIIFFLTLSLCSAGYCFSGKFFSKQNQKSRRNFAKYIRQATVDCDSPQTEPSPELKPRSPVIRKISAPEKRHRPSILSRLNFEPSPALREQEPENEDRSVASPMAELCDPPLYRPELFMRRQTMPALHRKRLTEKIPTSTWKRASVGGRVL